MKIIVHSRANMIAAIPPETPWAVISICEAGDFPVIQTNDFQKGRLNLQFHDADVQAESETLFNDTHAQQIIDFYVEMEKHGVEVLFVHCLMGQARSAAVAAALEKTFNGTDDKYFRPGPYKPNMLVFRTLLNKLFDTGHLKV